MVAAIIRIFSCTSLSLLSCSFCLSASAHELPGMANWVDSADYLLRAPPDHTGENLLAAPDWMPGYLYQSLVFPRPYFRDGTRRATLSALKKGGIAALTITASLVTKTIVRYSRPPSELSDTQMPRDARLLNPKGMVANLTKTRTLLQLMTSEDYYDLALRGLILSGVSQWLQFKWKLHPEIADIPAHMLQWLSIARRVLKIFTPLATGQRLITFSSGGLNQLFEISFSSPLPTGEDPHIDINLHSGKTPALSDNQSEDDWYLLHQFCNQNRIRRLQLYPVSSSKGSRLYIKIWQEDEAGEPHLTKVSTADGSSPKSNLLWWTDYVRRRTRISTDVLDPLAPVIIGSLPDILSAALSSDHPPTQPVPIPKSHSSTHKNFAAVNREGKGLLLLDWQSDAQLSLLPRITLITEPVGITIPAGDLAAIQSLQAQPEQPLFKEIVQACYDVFWLYLATRF